METYQAVLLIVIMPLIYILLRFEKYQQEVSDYHSSSQFLSLANMIHSFCINFITVSVETYGTNFGSN